MLLGGGSLRAADPAAVSVFERNPEGWEDLLTSLSAWERVSPGTKYPLAAKDPWRLKDGVLACDADGVYELLLTNKVFGDGVLHVEWRYVGESEKQDSGILLRASQNGQEWYQAQLAPPGLGSFSTKGYNKAKVSIRRPELMRPAGEWNVMEITCRGSELLLWFNGENVSESAGQCGAGRADRAAAEFAPIEFRKVKFRAVKTMSLIALSDIVIILLTLLFIRDISHHRSA